MGLCVPAPKGGAGRRRTPAGVGESIPTDETERRQYGGITAMFNESSSKVRRLLRAATPATPPPECSF